MAINKYNNSFYSKLFDFADTSIIAWANNIFDKIKASGILPEYIERSKSIKRTNLTSFDKNSVTEDSLFRWGVRKKPLYIYNYPLSQEVNIGTVHILEFEVSSDGFQDGNVLDGICKVRLFLDGTDKKISYITSSETKTDTITITQHSIVKIIRINESISFYCDSILISVHNLNNNEEFKFDRLSSGNVSTGEIKISREDILLHYWKLNSINDEGLNDKDFYAIWYSISYLFAIIYRYSSYLGNISNEVILLKKFLSSKGIECPVNISEVDLKSLYSEWQENFDKRGTYTIIDKKKSYKGICLLMTNVEYGFSPKDEPISLGNDYSLEFDWSHHSSMDSGLGGYMFYGITSKVGSTTKLIEFITTPTEISFKLYGYLLVTIEKDSSIKHIKLRRRGSDYWFYIDEILKREVVGELSSTNNDFVAIYSETPDPTFIKGLTGKVANIIINTQGYNIFYRLNTPSYVLEEETSAVSVFSISPKVSYFSTVNAPNLSNLFTKDDNFDNIKDCSVDGELLRYVDHSYSDEFILAMNSNIGWTLDKSSPGQKQTYPIVGFNKFHNKEKAIPKLENLPIAFGGVSATYFDSVTTSIIKDGVVGIKITPKPSISTSYGISIGSNIQTLFQYDLDKFLIPVNANLDYEISFRIKTINPDINIKFRPLCYSIDKQLVPPISAIGVESAGNYFLNIELNDVDGYRSRFIQKINDCGEVWIRGILYNSSTSSGVDSTKMNMNIPFGRNLIMDPLTTFLSPEILIESSTSNVSSIYIWDIQVRPITSNVDKGNLDTKNLLSLYSVNRGRMSKGDLVKSIESTLLPYNTFIKINELYSEPLINVLAWDSGDSVAWDSGDLIKV